MCIRDRDNIVLQGTEISHTKGEPFITLAPGDYLVNYRVTACPYRECNRYQNLRIALQVNNLMYPGGTANATSVWMAAVDMAGTTIVSENTSPFGLGIVNYSGIMVHFSDISITVVKLN